VNIIPGLTSLYHWQGKLESEQEVLLLIKSLKDKIPALEQKVLELHPYDTPEFVCLSADYVNDKYQKWLEGAL